MESIAAPNAGSFNIHTVHWSTVALGAAAAVALVALVAAIALSQIPLMVFGAVYFGVCAIGCYYTQTFSEYKSLESHNILLRQQIDELAQTNIRAKQDNERLQAAAKGLAETQRALDTQRAQYEKALRDQEASFKENLIRLSNINLSLEAEWKKVEKEAGQLTAEFEKRKITLEQGIKERETLIESLKKTVDELHQQVDRLEKQVKDQEAMVNRYDQENKEYDALNKDLEKQVQELKTTGGDRHLSTEKLSQISQGTLSLEAEVHKLTATLQERDKKIASLKDKITSYDERLKKLEAKKAASEKPS